MVERGIFFFSEWTDSCCFTFSFPFLSFPFLPSCLLLLLLLFQHNAKSTEWNAAEEDLADAERWEDDWDDDDVSDDFAKQLRTELEKVSKVIQK